MSHMRVIVTGANGFIGKRLVETLSHVWDVVEVDKNNMWEILNWEILEWDDVECIFHLGAISDTTSTDPMTVNSHNVNYTSRCLCCKRVRVSLSSIHHLHLCMGCVRIHSIL